MTTTCAKCGHSYLVSARRGSGATLERDLAAMLGVGVASKPPTPAPWPVAAELRAKSSGPEHVSALRRRWRGLPRALRLAVGGAAVVVVLLLALQAWPGERTPLAILRSTYCAVRCDDEPCAARCVAGPDAAQQDSEPSAKEEPKRSTERKLKRK